MADQSIARNQYARWVRSLKSLAISRTFELGVKCRLSIGVPYAGLQTTAPGGRDTSDE